MAVRELRRAAVWCVVVACACAAPRYAPCPVGLAGALPADAFAVCREVLRQRYGDVAVADVDTFRLQSGWVPVQDPPGERRATIVRDDSGRAPDLAVVVELRRVSVPLLGAPGWTTPRGDDAAERDLAQALRAALAPATAGR